MPSRLFPHPSAPRSRIFVPAAVAAVALVAVITAVAVGPQGDGAIHASSASRPAAPLDTAVVKAPALPYAATLPATSTMGGPPALPATAGSPAR